MKTFCENRKASHDYFILDRYECGIVLKGTEAKSIRQGKVNLKESYCSFKGEELFIIGMHVSVYDEGSIFNVNCTRERKLLMHKKELRSLIPQVAEKGNTLVPLKVYVGDGDKIKIEIGLCKGKHNYDKRRAIADREVKRDIDRELKSHY